MKHPQWIVKYGYRSRNPRIVRWHDHSEIAQVTSDTDAELIASAPELLEELKSLTEWTEKTFRALESAEWVNQDRLYHSIPKNIAERALEAARAAIEKAEA